MPISCEVSRKKNKSRTQIICESMQKVVDKARAQLTIFSDIKKEIEYEPGLFREAAEKGALNKDDAKALLAEHKTWKNEVKEDVKANVMGEKRRQKTLRKTKRQGSQPATQRKAPQKRRRSPGKFI